MRVNIDMPHQIGAPGELLPAKGAIEQFIREGFFIWLGNGLFNP